LIDRPEGGERVVLVHLHLRGSQSTSDLQEFHDLALAAGAEIVGEISSNRPAPDAKYFIGSGKVEELRALVEAQKVDVALFNNELSPAQERNLERIIKCRVIDRTGLILDIFARRARTYEGKLQVELAQLQHLSTRLIRGWTHLERQKGGIGLRGPGETQLEVDRRLIRERIKHIKAKLEKVRKQRDQGRRARYKASLPTISLVGYTNAGKSTLFNKLTGAHVMVANQLFATLDPTLRALELPILGKAIVADTVGFIRQLPHQLVVAFRATLEETESADLLLHVIDSQDPLRLERIKQVEDVLQEIGALAVPRIEVYNKIDLLPEAKSHVEWDGEGIARRVFVSAVTGTGLDLLKEAIVQRLGREMVWGELHLSPAQNRIRALLFDMDAVVEESTSESGDWTLSIRLPQQKWQQLCFKEPELERSLKQESKQTN
jgi:GTP-binding protein HflX